MASGTPAGWALKEPKPFNPAMICSIRLSEIGPLTKWL